MRSGFFRCGSARFGRLAAASVLAAFAATGWAQALVTGTATYRERIALTPDAVLEVTLEDVSRADAPAVVLGRARVEPAGQVPIRFEIAYDPAQIDDSHSYTLRARISAGGRLMFTTDRAYPVITRGNPTEVELILRRFSAHGPRPGTASDAPLANTWWKLAELRGQPVAADDNPSAPHIVLRADEPTRVDGSGGCNRLTGGYRIEGDTIAFNKMATTMMACPKGMDTEKEFLKALGEAKAWKITGQRLELRDEGGSVIARFDAVHMK
ncbi:MAG TPA: YbaY family lipoprotein [Burkholderiales bacterium]